MLGSLWQDLHYGMRMILKRPGISAVLALTLAVGIGANTAIFSVINGVLLRKLPYQDPDKLVIIWNDYGDQGQSLPAVSPPDFLDYKKQNKLFVDFAAGTAGTILGTANNITEDGPPERVEAGSVTANFFSLLGVQPKLGRAFTEAETVMNGAK